MLSKMQKKKLNLNKKKQMKLRFYQNKELISKQKTNRKLIMLKI